MNVYVGGDVSKGYADFCLMDGDGEILLEIQLDDTRQGHSRMGELIRKCHRKVDSEGELEVALEATGGMERNWLHLFRELDESGEADLEVYRFNPLVIRRFAEQNLHRNKTDEISARVLADYLRLGLAETKAAYTDEGPDDGLKTLARKTQRMTERSVDLQNELKALLQRTHPELVQYVRSHVSKWILRLIKQYPTPEQVAEAGPEALSEIPYVTEEKATRIVEAARTSVASQTDEDTGLTLSLVAEDLLRLTGRIDQLKERLWNKVRDRRAPHLIASIEGIGKWSAAGGKRRRCPRENDQQAGQRPHPIGALRLCDRRHPERKQSARAGPLRPAHRARQASEGCRGCLHAEASGDRVRVLEQR